MYNYIIGKITEITEGRVVVEAGGIGYEISVSNYCADRLGLGESAKIYTHLCVREDDMSLCGFYSKDEKDMFLKLTSVGGIGAKVAVSVLSGMPLEQLASCIAGANTSSLSKLKGIGKKTAERIVLELGDKMQGFSTFAAAPFAGGAAVDEDAVLALMGLGYTRAEANSAVIGVTEKDLSTEQIIMKALKKGI